MAYALGDEIEWSAYTHTYKAFRNGCDAFYDEVPFHSENKDAFHRKAICDGVMLSRTHTHVLPPDHIRNLYA